MRYAELNRELDAWVAEDLVTEAQAEAIRRRYAVQSGSERRGRAITALAVIGAVVGGLGIILFFAANWDAIPRAVRVAVLLATMVGAYGAGDLLRPRRSAVGGALLLLGAITFGASLFLVGQIVHVQAHDPLAFVVWTAACVPLALVERTRPLAVLSILTFGAWLVYEHVEYGGESLEALPVVAAVYGAALYAWGTALRDDLFAGPMRGLGFWIGSLGAFAFTFRAVATELGGRAPLETAEVLAFAALVTAALAGAALLGWRRELADAAAVLTVTALVGLAVLVPTGDGALAAWILFNVLVAALALGAVVAGHLRDEPWLQSSGIALVAIDIFARSIDVFWELLPRSLGFLGAGVVLLALAFGLERQRGRLVRSSA